MATHLTLICQAATPALRNAAFARPDDVIEESGRAKAAATPRLRADRSWTSPSLAARQTAELLGLDAIALASLRPPDSGSWAGRTVESLVAEAPKALAAWMTDPAAAPPGGESLCDLLARIAPWLEGERSRGERVIVIADAAVIRALIVQATEATPLSCLRIDIAPLSRSVLSFNGQWRLQGLGLPI